MTRVPRGWRPSYVEDEPPEPPYQVVKRLLVGTSPDADVRAPRIAPFTPGKVIQGVDPFHAEIRAWSNGALLLVDLGSLTTWWRHPHSVGPDALHWVPAGGGVQIPTDAVLALGYTDAAHGIVEVSGWAKLLHWRTRRAADASWATKRLRP